MRAFLTRVLAMLAAVTLLIVAVDLALDPTFQQVTDAMVLATGIPATLFVLIYATTIPWWETMIGRALLTSSLGLALLLDISLAARWFGYMLPDWGLIVVLAVILSGAWLKLAALFEGKRLERARRRSG